MKKTLLLLSFILLVLLLMSGFFWLYEVRYFVGRATTLESQYSLENSYVFLSPLRAKADGQEKIRLTVFILNNRGLGVAGKRVELDNDPDLKILAIKGISDEVGRAIFDISSNKTGEYYLTIRTEGKEFNQKAHLSFY